MSKNLPVQIKFFTKYNKISIAGQVPNINVDKFKIDLNKVISITVNGKPQGAITSAWAQKLVKDGVDYFAAVLVYKPAAIAAEPPDEKDARGPRAVVGAITITITNNPGGGLAGDRSDLKEYPIKAEDPNCNTTDDVTVPHEINLLP